MTQYLLSMPHDSAEEPTMASMDPAELEATLAVAGAFLQELADPGALVFAGVSSPVEAGAVPFSTTAMTSCAGELGATC